MKFIKSLTGALTIVIVLVLAGLIGLWVQNHSQANNLNDLNTKLNTLNKKLTIYQVNSAAQATAERPVMDSEGTFVYVPELRIKIPYNNVSKSLTYSLRGEGDGISATEADISSAAYIPPQVQTVINCSDLARIKIEPKPNPYNPHEKASSVDLGDGRTLQVYEAVNNKECLQSWAASMPPSLVAGAFSQATAY